MISKIFIHLCLLYSNDNKIFLTPKKKKMNQKNWLIFVVSMFMKMIFFFINPEINTLHGANGIYHLISKEFSENYSPESHLIKIKIGELWNDITNREICKFYFLNNLRDNISIKLIKIK